MKVLFLNSTHEGVISKGIYADLMHHFVLQGHHVTIAYSTDKPEHAISPEYINDKTRYIASKSAKMTKNRNMIQKGLATVMFDNVFCKTIREELHDESFDLVLYSTPPVTIVKTLQYLKSRNPNAFFYLMLKDIFPQNAIDLDIMRKNGIVYHYFKRQERKLYELSDFIGTMSPANLQYILKNNPQLENKTGILPNTITLEDNNYSSLTKEDLGFPDSMKLLFYGGNLGLPQSVPFILECFEKIENREDVGLVIVGSGAMDYLITDYISSKQPTNLFYSKHKPFNEYMNVMNVCDIGLIFLDYRFTIPNFPQRLLSYMAQKLPVVCATDRSSDMGRIAEENEFGYYVPSNDSNLWKNTIEKILSDEDQIKKLGENGYNYLVDNYTSTQAYNTIISQMEAIKYGNRK